MEKLKEVYFNSYLYFLITLFSERVIPAVVNTFNQSYFKKIWIFFNEKILKLPFFKLIFDTEYISGIWYKSYFYRVSTMKIRKASYHIPRASYKFRPIYIGVFIGILLLIPDFIWSNLFWLSLFSAIVIFYLSRNIRNRTGTVFALVNVVILIFLLILEITLPYSAVISAQYLLFGVDLFFIISFSVKNLDDLKETLVPIFLSAAILCFMGIIQDAFLIKSSSAIFTDGIRFGEILMLIFPFVFVYPLEFLENPRKSIYAALIFILFFNAILATNSKAALIGFVVEMAIFIIHDIRFFPFLIILMPMGLASIIDNIKTTWYATTSYGNIVNNLINLSHKVWNLGFGVDREKFMAFYDFSSKNYANQDAFINIPYVNISPVYINFIIDIGTVIMIIFFAYILRLAHSSFTMLVTGEKKYKRFFAAGLATLLAISVSAFFETTMFASRTMLIYWAMLGILRAVRIMNLGVYET